MTTTWELAFEQVRAASPAGIDLITLCAFLALEEIPIELVRNRASGSLDKLAVAMKDDLVWDQAVAALRRYSLVETNRNMLSIGFSLCSSSGSDDLEQYSEARVWSGPEPGMVCRS